MPYIRNPEAGAHPVTADPVELEAVHAAAQRTWDAFPYYAHRYGERGRRFCDSDTAWLVTLAAMQRAAAVRQVQWLGSLLAARGMPQLLLETHLRHLYAALRSSRYANLRHGSSALAQARRGQIAEPRFRELASTFNDRANALPNLGQLLVAAVCDEGLGIAAAVTSMEEWMPRQWRAAAAIVSAAARAVRNAR
jgi:hypothetical protein